MLSANVILAILEVIKGRKIEEAAIKNFTTKNRVLEAVRDLNSRGLLSRNEEIKASVHQRIQLIYLALKWGASVKEVSKTVGWRDFEEITSRLFEENGYSVRSHVILSNRREIDVLARKKNDFIAVDCKHWTREIYPSVLERIVKMQLERIQTLVNELNIKANVYPLIVVLQRPRQMMWRGVPVIPISYLNDFLLNFEALKRKIVVFSKF